MDQLIHIEAYILGELEGSELAAFLDAMSKDPEMEKEVARQGELVARLDGMRLRSHVQQHKVSRRSGTRSTFILWMSAAAAATILAVAVLWLYRGSERDPAQQAQEQIIPPSGPITGPVKEQEGQEPMGDSPAVASPGTAGGSGQVIVSTEWKAVVLEELDRLEIPDPGFMGAEKTEMDLADNYRKAHLAMRAENATEALRIIAEIERVAPEWYADDLQWMRALCALLQDPGQGKREITMIANDPNHEHRIRAMQVLGKLER